MFKDSLKGYNVPMPGTVEAMEVKPATRGGGYILNLTVSGKLDTMVFTDANMLTQTLMAMLNGAALMQMAASRPPADVGERMGAGLQTIQPPVQPKKKGRPKLTEAEKAANRDRRAKANNAHVPSETVAEAA